jgi:squalene-hopene/tetraprenyl-beta-curcumene cyclase
MKLIPVLFLALGITAGKAAEANQNRYESLRQEIRQSIARGNAWLKSQQKPEGYWDDGELPALTALALTAATRDPNFDRSAPFPEHIEKAYAWLLAQQKEDGGIYNRGLSVYNTATSVTALVSSGRKDFEPAIVKARKHLIDNQWDIGQAKETDDPNDGGVGYGSSNTHTDMSNTYLAIEALALSKKVIEDGNHGDQPDLDWDAAITFLSRSQNLEETNDQEWASNDPKNKGGFVYTPGESKAGEDELPDGRTALRSYGSISYAGLLSFIYAKLSPEDPRVVAVKEWLGRNYTVEENPNMGAQGLYYYYQTMSKALTAANISMLTLENGKEADWRNDLGSRLLANQREDGSWVNANGRWMESNPVLVTAYTVLSLSQVYDSIPAK